MENIYETMIKENVYAIYEVDAGDAIIEKVTKGVPTFVPYGEGSTLYDDGSEVEYEIDEDEIYIYLQRFEDENGNKIDYTMTKEEQEDAEAEIYSQVREDLEKEVNRR